MNTILRIIEAKGGLEKLEADGSWKIKSGSYMDLNIDFLGKGPNGLPMVAIAHNYIQNGDVMADPDMQVEIGQGLKGLELFPVTFQNDGVGLFQRVYECDESGKVTGFRPKLKKQLRGFLRMWGANLRSQGFLRVAQATT